MSLLPDQLHGRAELGLVVADAWQRQGIGSAVAARLLHAAEARGYHRFVVHGFANNPALRPLLDNVAEVVSTHTRFGVSEITLVRRQPPAAADLSTYWRARGPSLALFFSTHDIVDADMARRIYG